jgi:hypothetical protein
MMTGITCVNCYDANATQVIKDGACCVACFKELRERA